MPLHATLEAPAYAAYAPLQTATVIGVSDPLGLGRVQIRLLNCAGYDTQESLIWARVAVPFAGSNYGAFLLPGKDDEVVVAFLNGDPRFPIVVGSLWHGSAKPTEELPGDDVDRWTFTGRHGSRIAIVEPSQSEASVSFTLPGGVSGELKAEGTIEFRTPQASVTMNREGIIIRSKQKVEIQASSEVTVTAPQVNVNAASSTFSGKVTCASLETASVTSAAYSVGAGNVW